MATNPDFNHIFINNLCFYYLKKKKFATIKITFYSVYPYMKICEQSGFFSKRLSRHAGLLGTSVPIGLILLTLRLC